MRSIALWAVAILTASPLGWCADGSNQVSPSESWPLWDEEESVAQYARRVNLPQTTSLDLGGGVMLETVLIPAGTFVMGTAEPQEVGEDVEEGIRRQILAGRAICAAGAGALLAMLAAVVFTALRNRSRPRFSLARLLVMTLAAGIAVLGGLHWLRFAQMAEQVKAEYYGAKARYEQATAAEKPAQSITVPRPFYMGKFTVTNAQYLQISGAIPKITPIPFKGAGANTVASGRVFKGNDHPVETVTWKKAQEFCERLSSKSGYEVRLPTEAEWEYACRARTTSSYHTGDKESDLARTAWYSANSNGTAHPVGQKEPNALGLYDMHGNVFQWCRHWKGDDPESPSRSAYEALNDRTEKNPYDHVLRGSSWYSTPLNSRSASRCFDSHWDYDNLGMGFRIVLEPSLERTAIPKKTQ